ncbi:epoxide hydrolase N-terminal domain-containing protein [Nocardia sp. NBC_00511]|uniref:epoxide hydrolase family protein n=1 Tax=Nocardia sp. NBC_00511 TaxID=2903591 RepID=UPI002F90D9B3
MNADIAPFRIQVPQVDLDDLRERLTRTRSPYPISGTGSDRDHGIAPDYLRELAEYWARRFDWRAHEATLNTYPQFLTEIDGQNIHFLHLRSPEPDATPLLLNHSFPTSFTEFLETAGPLTDPRGHGGNPADAFHVVIPSLPGFVFSTPLSARGWNLGRTALAFGELMTRLGYERFGVAGGDIGAGVGGQLVSLLPERVIGALTVSDRLQVGMAGEDFPVPDGLTAEEHKQLEAAQYSWSQGKGYRVLQNTQPNALAAGLADSPILQLAWIAEKLQEWANPESPISRDDILTTASLYWFTRTGPGAADFYWEMSHTRTGWASSSPVPQGSSLFYSDPLVRKILGPGRGAAFFADHAEGGHFPALEVPALFVEDLRTFYRELHR